MTTVMDMTVILVLFIFAHSTPVMGVSRQYLLINQKKTWRDAQMFCRGMLQDLATIETSEENKIAKSMLKTFGISWAWIGLYDDVNSWKWSMGDQVVYEGGNTNVGDWFNLTQDNHRSKEYCAAVHHSGTLADYDCNLKFYSVCYDEPSNIYIPVTAASSWSSAQTYCRNSYTDLTSMRSLQEKQNIMSVISNQSAWWVGLYRDKWKWSDQTSSSFRAWKSREPSSGVERCAAIGTYGWNDVRCGQRAQFFCSAATFTTVRVVFKLQRSLSLNDSMIQEAILKHMEQQIRDQGIDQQLKFSWRKWPNGLVFNNNQTQL